MSGTFHFRCLLNSYFIDFPTNQNSIWHWNRLPKTVRKTLCGACSLLPVHHFEKA